jgi:hypothetical protein
LPAKAFPGVTGLPGGPHDLTNKALRPGRSTPSVANTAGSDMQVIVARIHSGLDMPGISDGSGAIVFSDTLAKAPAGNFVGGRKSPSATVTSVRQQSALLSRLPRSVCPCSQSRTAKNAKSFDRMRFSSFAAHATIRIANKTDVTALQAAIPTEGKHATVLTTVQGEAASRRPFGRPGRPLRVAASTMLVGTEEWCRPRSNRGMEDSVNTELTINLPMSTREVRGR